MDPVTAVTDIHKIKLPNGFVSTPERIEQLSKYVISTVLDTTWRLDYVDVTHAVFVKESAVANVRETVAGIEISLPHHLRTPSAGNKIAEAYGAQFPGYVLTRFQPHVGLAVFSKLSSDVVTARAAIAEVFGVAHWDVEVRKRKGGGYTITRMPSKYTPSLHDKKLTEAVTTKVPGSKPGWFVRVNPQALTAEIIPGELPTFPPMIPYPFLDAITTDDSVRWKLPVGKTLGHNDDPGGPLVLDFAGTPGAMVVGVAGGGKSVVLNSLITGALERGFELVICDVPHKAVDFLWCKDFVRDGGWGCDSPEGTLAALKMVYEEKHSRSALLEQYGVQKIQDLPTSVQPAPILVVLDEVTGMFALEEVPKGVPKDHPIVQEPLQYNLVVQVIKSIVGKIPAELRFVGIRLVLSTQMAQANTGISVPLKTNLANRLLLGVNANDSARGHAFLDARSVPPVPAHIRADPVAGRGVGASELDGVAPSVFKGYFASTNDLGAHLVRLGVPRTSRPSPTAAEIRKYVPRLDDGDFEDDGPVPSALDGGGFGAVDGRDVPDVVLRGAARAAHESRLLEQQANAGTPPWV